LAAAFIGKALDYAPEGGIEGKIKTKTITYLTKGEVTNRSAIEGRSWRSMINPSLV